MLTKNEIVLLLREYNSELHVAQKQLHIDSITEYRLNPPDYNERARIGKEHKINRDKIITMNIFINTIL